MVERYADLVDMIAHENNHKDTLLRFFQKHFNGAFPVYKEIAVDVDQNGIKTYTCGVISADNPDHVIATGTDRKKRTAEQECSRKALEYFGVGPEDMNRSFRCMSTHPHRCICRSEYAASVVGRGVLMWPKSFSWRCKVLMNASVLTLIAKGSADKYLTGTPQVSFFKAVFKRYTNFSSFSQEVVMGGSTSWGGLARCTLPRQGDLVTDMYISVALPSVSVTGSDPLVRWTDKLGHAMVEFVEVWIGGEMVERHTGEWLELLSQLTQSDEKRRIYYNLIGHKGSPDQRPIGHRCAVSVHSFAVLVLSSQWAGTPFGRTAGARCRHQGQVANIAGPFTHLRR